LIIRTATAEDIEAIAETVVEGFRTFGDFAPANWKLPDPPIDIEAFRAQMQLDGIWSRVAEDEGVPVAHVTILPAQQVDWRPLPDDPRAAFLWQIYTRRRYWGSGLAAELHGLAVAEARRQGFTAMLLYTPEGQARARRFYEREGWEVFGEPIGSRIGLTVVGYRLALEPS
jgi:GNAT superfamily N-acetyltransferase